MGNTEITLSASIWICEELARGRMAGLESVLRAQICERVGVLAVSIMLSAIKRRPCFPPPPALMRISTSMGGANGSKSGP